ncbi:hypothetical protein EVAR_49836_1 [Eumeta japonica]|uniref:Uncharacterized protein n=1 Tax=Eumeta variegata TaxID=151549 RepID=A0A4C1YW48_EUMVA|nr:hypothetical protein EVAR_49836_1 [Eumeta japonica]
MKFQCKPSSSVMRLDRSWPNVRTIPAKSRVIDLFYEPEPSIRYSNPSQKGGDVLVTPLRLRVFMGGGDYLLRWLACSFAPQLCCKKYNCLLAQLKIRTQNSDENGDGWAITASLSRPVPQLCAASVSLVLGRIDRWSGREIACSALSLTHSAQAERDNESCFFFHDASAPRFHPSTIRPWTALRSVSGRGRLGGSGRGSPKKKNNSERLHADRSLSDQ